MNRMETGKRQEILAKHEEYLFSCVANYYDEPLVVDRAKDSLVYDVEGREYLDFFGGIVTISVGHCNDKVVAAIQEQTRKVQHTSTLYPTEPHVRLAEKLAAITPGALKKSFFTNSGTEANETAVLAAQLYTRAQDVVRPAAWIQRPYSIGHESDRGLHVAAHSHHEPEHPSHSERLLLPAARSG